MIVVVGDHEVDVAMARRAAALLSTSRIVSVAVNASTDGWLQRPDYEAPTLADAATAFREVIGASTGSEPSAGST